MATDEPDESEDAGGGLGEGPEMGELFGGDVDLDKPGGELGESGNPIDDEIDPGRIEVDEGPAR